MAHTDLSAALLRLTRIERRSAKWHVVSDREQFTTVQQRIEVVEERVAELEGRVNAVEVEQTAAAEAAA
jgi:predicted  nucleic acid-binding Zn-ribbon protein